jgi:hypothetical protein
MLRHHELLGSRAEHHADGQKEVGRHLLMSHHSLFRKHIDRAAES